MSRRTFEHVRPGDTVSRMLAGHPMRLRVTAVDDELIYCGPPGSGWSFDRISGLEIDHEIGWGPQYGITGSYLVHEDERDSEWMGSATPWTRRRR